MLDLDAIKQRLAAASPGPWQWFGSEGAAGTFGMLSTKGNAMIGIRQANQWPIDAEMRLIEHAPADMAALVAEVERLRAAMDEEDDLHDAIKQQCFGLDEARKERDAWKDLCRYWRRMAHRFADPETIVKALEADARLEVEADARA